MAEAAPNLEPLSAVDAAFLSIEDERDPMHVALACLFEKVPELTVGGKLDTQRIVEYHERAAARLPRFRRRLATAPYTGHPFFVEGQDLDWAEHVRCLELPAPGKLSQLKELLGRIYTEPLVRTRPLWETWVIDGLEGGRFATVSKAHHAVVDGVSGVIALSTFLRGSPDPAMPERAALDVTAPSSKELLRADLDRRRSGVRDFARELRAHGSGSGKAAASGVGPWARALLRSSSRTPLNPSHIGALRLFDWARIDLERVRAVKRACDATVNDVVLAIVAGAVRAYLAEAADVDRVEMRALVPVSLHDGSDTHLHNAVSMRILPLFVHERDPRQRLLGIRDAARDSKRSRASDLFELVELLLENGSQRFVRLMLRAALARRPFNLIITNIPGPQFPLYLLGARLLETYPLVPLFINQSVGIAVLSYCGGLYFGFNADAASMDDLPRFVRCVLRSMQELEETFGVVTTGQEVRSLR